MEWVEITAKSIEEAKELAPDQLGVGIDEAAFEGREEQKAGGVGGRTLKLSCEAGSRKGRPHPGKRKTPSMGAFRS